MSHEEFLVELRKSIGPPFCFVDEVIAVDAETKTISTKFLYDPFDVGKPYLKAHLLSELLLPGVLILEGMAQTCGILAMGIHGGRLEQFYSCGYDKARFRAKVVPGTMIFFQAKLETVSRNLWKFDVRAHDAQGKEFGEAEYLLFAK